MLLDNGKRFRVNIDDNLKYPTMPISDVLLKALHSISDEVLDSFHKPMSYSSTRDTFKSDDEER